MFKAASAALITAFAVAASANADPCKAIPDKGPMPAYLHKGATFAGPVVYVGDGDGLCVAVGEAPSAWVEVRLADFYVPELGDPGGPEAKAALETIAKGRAVSCVADHRSYDRIVAACTLNGRDLGDVMRATGIAEGGRGH